MTPTSPPERFSPSLTIGTALVFGAGFLMETYGLFFMLSSAKVLWGFAWIAGGLVLQVASGAFSASNRGTMRLTNPVPVLTQALRDVRNRVRGWDERP